MSTASVADHMMKQLSFVLLVGLAACSKTSDPAQKGSGKATESAPAADDKLAGVLPAKAPPAFAAWDLPARAKAWQGAHVVDGLAYEIAGTVAKVWDGTAEKKLTFTLESPCSAKLMEKSADGSESGSVATFTLKGGKLVAGLGEAGSRKGKSAIACVGGQVLTLDDAGTCLAWSSMFEWKSEPGTCAFAQQGGKEVFTAKVNNSDTTLVVDGDALMTEQLVNAHSSDFPDYAAAKAALAKK